MVDMTCLPLRLRCACKRGEGLCSLKGMLASLDPTLYDFFFFNYINKCKCFHFCFSLIQLKSQQ